MRDISTLECPVTRHDVGIGLTTEMVGAALRHVQHSIQPSRALPSDRQGLAMAIFLLVDEDALFLFPQSWERFGIGAPGRCIPHDSKGSNGKVRGWLSNKSLNCGITRHGTKLISSDTTRVALLVSMRLRHLVCPANSTTRDTSGYVPVCASRFVGCSTHDGGGGAHHFQTFLIPLNPNGDPSSYAFQGHVGRTTTRACEDSQ